MRKIIGQAVMGKDIRRTHLFSVLQSKAGAVMVRSYETRS